MSLSDHEILDMKSSPMPTRALLLSTTLLAFLAFAGCTSPADSPAPAADTTEADAGVDAAAFITYQCPSGGTVEASYPTDSTAVVRYQGQERSMTIAVSASGARYVGDELEWWTKGSGSGSEGTLFRHESDGTTGELVETCTQP